jgi:hypothetical protein
MKFLDTHFDEYIQSSNSISLHPSFKKTIGYLPNHIADLNNIILYGPSGVGKYTQMLQIIKKYSPSELKYEKKMTVTYNKINYYFKISDIHFEIDMGLLGCNAKLLWNDIFTNIIDVLSARINKHGIIICKNFHKIHPELLECFYSYIQKNNSSIDLVYILISEHISFIPDNIVNVFHTISLPRPSRTNYNKIINKKLHTNYKTEDIYNIKNILTDTHPFINNVNNYIDVLYNLIVNIDGFKYLQFRNFLYDLFIYDMEMGYVIWKLINKVIETHNLSNENITKIYISTYAFLQYYNNNYRPIYHLENYLYNLINIIHEF